MSPLWSHLNGLCQSAAEHHIDTNGRKPQGNRQPVKHTPTHVEIWYMPDKGYINKVRLVQYM